MNYIVIWFIKIKKIMKNVIYILFFFVSLLNAQTPDHGVSYLDFNNKPTLKENAVFYEFKTVYKDSLWKYQKYYIPSNTKTYLVEKYFYDKDNFKQGKFSSYRRDGTKLSEGYYLNNLKNDLENFFGLIHLIMKETKQPFYRKK